MTVADDARALVARTTAAQGLPEMVSDVAVLTKVAAILGASPACSPARDKGAHHGAPVPALTITTTAASARRGSRGPS